jgi:hypothetical protein
MTHKLSKSTFIRGVQCPKSIFLHKNFPELRDTISGSQQAVFTQGTNVGQLARQLFPNGIDVSPENYYDFEPSIQKTREVIKDGHPVIYEAAFQYDGTLAAIDILVNHKGKWKAFEVKSGSSISDTYILDTALQYHVITNSGIELDDISIVFINNQYIRTGEINIHELFTITSVCKEVISLQGFISDKIIELKELLKSGNTPEIDIGPQCTDPYPCDFIGNCWQHIPEDSIFDLYRLNTKKKFYLYNKGFISFDDLTDDVKLTKAQQLQVDCAKNGNDYINIKGIKAFLKSLHYPLYFLDFETFMPAVPLFENTRPYQQIPFQYSLHYMENPESPLIHKYFLGDGKTDPRGMLLKQLLQDTEGKGSILVYNQAFEITRLKELARDFPDNSERIYRLIKRIKDLLPPFQQKLYYSPKMHGSASIKSVLPALVPNLSYQDMEIADGGAAMSAYAALHNEIDGNEIQKVREALLKYCHLDTLAMVKILEKLFEIAY